MEWVLSGIGTLFIGFFLGVGADRYYLSRRSDLRIEQKQKAGNNSNLTQSVERTTSKPDLSDKQ